MTNQNFIKVSDSFFVDSDFAEPLGKLGLTSIDTIFAFDGGDALNKPNLAKHRARIKFQLPDTNTTLFLKRYDRPPISGQIKNWLAHRKRASTSSYDRNPCQKLAAAGIDTPKIIAYGSKWAAVFEERSFIITEQIPGGQSLEKKLPDFFYKPSSSDTIKCRRKFIKNLADFAKRFHETGFRHRDFYLAHIFGVENEKFYLIDLQRAFKPGLLKNRFQLKDIAQLHYSAPGNYFSDTDRLRFYKQYTNRKKLNTADKRFIRKVMAKAWRMAVHDLKHGRNAPFAM